MWIIEFVNFNNNYYFLNILFISHLFSIWSMYGFIVTTECRQFPGAVEYPPNIDGSLIHRSPRMAINGWFFRVEKTGRRRPRPKNSPSAMDPWSTWRIWRDGGAMWQGRAAKQIRSSSFSNPTMLDGLGLFRNLREKLLTFWDALSQIRGSQSPTWISVHVCILGLAGMMHEVSWLINQLGHLYRRLMNRTGGRCAPLRMRRDYGCLQIISSNQLHQWRFFLAAWSLDIRILGWSNIFKHDQIDPTSQIHIFARLYQNIPKFYVLGLCRSEEAVSKAAGCGDRSRRYPH